MALLALKTIKQTHLHLEFPDENLYPLNHIFEPEYHQDKYVSVCERTSHIQGAFQIGSESILKHYPFRGIQPVYADDENDASTLEYEGMLTPDGKLLDDKVRNVCALKSASVRFGFLDFGLARSVSREFYEARESTAGVKKNDVLVNSTGDGTIGRVAVYNQTFPALVDGHITILRFKDVELAWYAATYLLSKEGQLQLYRYVNGSSGQVEIYPQDIARVWVPPVDPAVKREIKKRFSGACAKHDQFCKDLQASLNMVTTSEGQV